jgi:hypothetical protein
MEDGEEFTIFRQVFVKPRQNQPKIPKAVLHVKFQIARMTPQQNIGFSLIPIPFIIGLPGFRSKLWMVNESTDVNQGIHEWETEEVARFYANSFAMQFMKKRSVPGSLCYEILIR